MICCNYLYLFICFQLSTESSKNPSKWFCEKHKVAEVTHFCMNCSTPLCYGCLIDIIGKYFNPHQGHTIHGVDKALEEIREKFKAKLQKVRFLWKYWLISLITIIEYFHICSFIILHSVQNRPEWYTVCIIRSL